MPLPELLLLTVAAAAVTWYCGTKIVRYVDAFARRVGLGQAFAGMLLLGGITSLPEVATAGTAAVAGNSVLSMNNLIGTATINLIVLAVCDIIYGRDALTSVAGSPGTLMQGVLGMILFTGVGLAILTADFAIPIASVGVGMIGLAAAAAYALLIARRFEDRGAWEIVDPVEIEPVKSDFLDIGKTQFSLRGTAAIIGVLVGGATLALCGDAVAERTGLGDSIVGFALIGLATSLPEFSSVAAALRLKRYQMAIGDIFGTNLFNIQILLIADLLYRDGALLNRGGAFEVGACLLAAAITGIFVVGLLERRDRTVLRMGWDSAIAILAFAVGLSALSLIEAGI